MRSRNGAGGDAARSIRRQPCSPFSAAGRYGEILGLIPLFFFTLTFLLDGQLEGVADGVLWITAGTVTIMIGTGMWVEGRHGKGFWGLIKDAMALERTEVGDLARAFFQPSGADRILDLLAQVALIDQDLDQRERAFVQSFADAWGIDFSWEDLARRGEEGSLNVIKLRSTLAKYLATSPPEGQAAQLGDVIISLVHPDEEVTEEEEMVLSELGGMITAYVDGGDETPRYAVALVPQSEAQERAIRSLLPDVGKQPLAGGSAFVAGEFFSDQYAEVVRGQYRTLNVFTTVLRV